jgi:hypothetical protein
MSRSFIPWLAFVCVSVASSAALAGDRPKLVVLPFSAGEGAKEDAVSKFTGLVVDELKGRDGVDATLGVVTRAATPDRAAARSKGPNPEAVSALTEGRKAFDELRFEDATSNLRRGIEGMLSDPATADFELISDSQVKLAAAWFRMSEEKEAKTALLDLARMNPTFNLPGGFPPVFVREFEKAKKRLDKQPRGQLSVEGPPGSTAFIDGRDLGMVPVVEEAVPAGIHYVRVDTGKGDRFGQQVEVKGAMTRVKAVFAGSTSSTGERAVIATAANPNLGASIDDAGVARLLGYMKSQGADLALVGYVYRSSDTQLTAGTALFSVKKAGFATFAPVTFDTDVLTANTDAFKLVDEVMKRVSSFGDRASLPVQLGKSGRATVVATRTDTPRVTRTDDLDPVTPTSRKVVLTPEPQTRALDNPSTVVDIEKKPDEPLEPTPAVKSGGVPGWVWVVVGVGVAAGVGVGGYFGYTALTKPVTGTVTATW